MNNKFLKEVAEDLVKNGDFQAKYNIIVQNLQHQIDRQDAVIERLQRDVKRLQNPSGDSQ